MGCSPWAKRSKKRCGGSSPWIEAASAQLLAEAAGKPIRISNENASRTRSQVGSKRAGWFQFQPLLSVIAREQPDCFE